MSPVYFDHNATTPLDAAIGEAMADLQRRVFANPSSIHHLGREARVVLDDARERLAACWRCKPSELVFTSGATEANNLAIFGTTRRLCARGRHLVASAIEHPSVLAPLEHLVKHEGFLLTLVPPLRSGRVEAGRVVAALRPDTILVSLMAANNELGTLQPVREVGSLCRDRGIVFHCDAAQWFGKMPVDSLDAFNANLVSVSAHKFHGPKGAGALFVRSGLRLEPLVLGGSQEYDRRAGTENLAAILGLALAVERHTAPPVFDPAHLLPLTDRLRQAARQWAGVTVLGDGVPTLPNTVSLAVKRTDAVSLLAALDLDGICASSGSACSAGSLTPSYVLAALDLPGDGYSLLRFSLGRDSSRREVELVIDRTPRVIERIRREASPRDNL